MKKTELNKIKLERPERGDFSMATNFAEANRIYIDRLFSVLDKLIKV